MATEKGGETERMGPEREREREGRPRGLRQRQGRKRQLWTEMGK